jgi:hypothetical protein
VQVLNNNERRYETGSGTLKNHSTVFNRRASLKNRYLRRKIAFQPVSIAVRAVSTIIDGNFSPRAAF